MRHLTSGRVLAAGAVLATGGVLTGSPVLAVPGGLLLAFVLPGSAAVRALFPARGLTRLERYVLSVALSLAVLVLGGLGLYAAGVALHRTTWAGLTGGVTLAAAFAGYLRGRTRPQVAAARVTVTAARLVPLVLVALLLTGAGWVSLASAARQSSATRVTALSIVDVSGTDEATRTHAMTLQVTNQEAAATWYTLRVTGPGGYLVSLRFTVREADPWRLRMTVPASDRVTANLYRDGDTLPYRTVYVHGSEAAS